MQITVSEDLRSNPNLLDLVESANTVIARELGRAADEAAVTWTLTTDSALRPNLDVKIVNGQICGGAFLVHDVRNAETVRRRLHDWCGNLIRAHRCP